MRIDVSDEFEGAVREKPVKPLGPARILRYLLGVDEALETEIICNPSAARYITTDKALYEALGSLKEYDSFKINKLVKLLEAIELRGASGKTILKEEDVERIRKAALSGAAQGKEQDKEKSR